MKTHQKPNINQLNEKNDYGPLIEADNCCMLYLIIIISNFSPRSYWAEESRYHHGDKMIICRYFIGRIIRTRYPLFYFVADIGSQEADFQLQKLISFVKFLHFSYLAISFHFPVLSMCHKCAFINLGRKENLCEVSMFSSISLPSRLQDNWHTLSLLLLDGPNLA